MLKAFVLTQIEPRKKDILSGLPKGTNLTVGRWDTATIVEAETPRALADHVIGKIRTVDGIRTTETLPVLAASVKGTQPSFTLRALVLLNTLAARTNQVFGNLASLPEALEVYTVAGRYDLIATIGASTWEDLGERIVQRIRSIEGVTSTETALIIS